jgi:hypothetical protein
MKPLRLAALAAALLVGACTATPTDTPAADRAAPSFDTGNGIGSGNRAGEDGQAGTNDSGSGTTAPDTTGRGGGLLGSGN